MLASAKPLPFSPLPFPPTHALLPLRVVSDRSLHLAIHPQPPDSRAGKMVKTHLALRRSPKQKEIKHEHIEFYLKKDPKKLARVKVGGPPLAGRSCKPRVTPLQRLISACCSSPRPGRPQDLLESDREIQDATRHARGTEAADEL